MDIDPIQVSLQGRIINNTVKSVLTAVFSLLEVLPFWLMNLPFRSILSALKCNDQFFICYQEASMDLSVDGYAGCKSMLCGENCTRRSLIQAESVDSNMELKAWLYWINHFVLKESGQLQPVVLPIKILE